MNPRIEDAADLNPYGNIQRGISFYSLTTGCVLLRI